MECDTQDRRVTIPIPADQFSPEELVTIKEDMDDIAQSIRSNFGVAVAVVIQGENHKTVTPFDPRTVAHPAWWGLEWAP